MSLALACVLAAIWPRAVAGFFYHSWMVAIVHLITLGWITCSILGAIYIVGPVALRMPMPARRGDYVAYRARRDRHHRHGGAFLDRGIRRDGLVRGHRHRRCTLCRQPGPGRPAAFERARQRETPHRPGVREFRSGGIARASCWGSTKCFISCRASCCRTCSRTRTWPRSGGRR